MPNPNYRIINYIPTPDIERQIGLVTVLHSGMWLGYYKLVNKKDGGFFVAPATVQAGLKEDGKPDWKDGFAAQDKPIKDQLFADIREFVKNESKSNDQIIGRGVPF